MAVALTLISLKYSTIMAVESPNLCHLPPKEDNLSWTVAIKVRQKMGVYNYTQCANKDSTTNNHRVLMNV